VELNVDIVEDVDGGVVLLAGVPAWYWSGGDVVGRRLAAVEAVATGAAPARSGGRGLRGGGVHAVGLAHRLRA